MKHRTLFFLIALFSLALLTSACQVVVEVAKEERNKEIVRRFVREGKNRENPAVFGEIFSPDYQHHFKIPGEDLPPGLAGSGRVGEIFGIAFPEIEVTIESLIAEGDYVLERSSVKAFHSGPFRDIPATNKTITWTEHHVYHIVDGLIVEHWPEWDQAGVYEQLGVLPAEVETQALTPVTEVGLMEIALTGPIAVRDSEISGMAWYGDHLILMPQYPDFAVEEGEGYVFALAKTDILAYLDGTRSEPLAPLQIPFQTAGLIDEIENFEGYEAIAFIGDTVYLTIESSPEAGMKGWLVSGTIMPDLSALSLSSAKPVAIEPQAPINNHTDETLLVADEMLVTLYESTGAALVSAPVAHRFDTALTPVDTIPYLNIEYRITDATALDANNRFWAINYFFPGDEVLLPNRDPLAETYGQGVTHVEFDHVERLVEFQYDGSGIILTETAPLQLELIEAARNWEGLVRLDDRGFLMATDKWPQMILGFVPFEN